MTTRRRRQWTAERNGCSSLLRGEGSRAALEQITGRAPMWAPLSKGWSCQEDTLSDALALAQALGIDVNVMGPRARRSRAIDALRAAPAPRWSEQTDPGSGRW